jgi:hypothetical protein
MDDEQPFYAPDRRPAPPRQPKPGEHLWTFVRGSNERRAELRTTPDAGVELQIFVNREFVNGRRYENRALALLNADGIRDTLAASGWTCTRCVGEGWICETHSREPVSHEHCSEPGVPCPCCNTSDPPRPPRGFVRLVARD